MRAGYQPPPSALRAIDDPSGAESEARMATDETTQPLPEEIASALAGVWKRHFSRRPTDGSAEIRGNVVKWSLGASAESERPEEEDAVAPEIRLQAYRRDASAAVSKSTHCRVVAFISERDADTDASTEIFVLETAPKSSSFGDPGWIAR
jgi:hypothetical protein